MKVRFLLIVLLSAMSNILYGQLTYVPDDNFEQALINLGCDSGELDDYVPTLNINRVCSLYVNNENISDLTGIEDFTALQYLSCSNNNLSSIDLSHNKILTSLFCAFNQLTNLDVSHNTILTNIYCNNNHISTIDLTHNELLANLYCYNNDFSNLDVSYNPVLTNLDCHSNNLTSLDLSHNESLTTLNCSYNELNELKIRDIAGLEIIYCHYNNLEGIDLNNHSHLLNLNCSSNNLLSLDVTDNKDLTYLNCNYNKIPELDITNNSRLGQLYCRNNYISNTLDASNLRNLYTLECRNNNIPNLDVSQCSKLEELYCQGNDIENIDLTGCSSITDLYCYNNKIVNLNLADCHELYYLHCYNNKINNINVSQCSNLRYLNCQNNNISNLDLSNNTNLASLNCSRNQLPTLDITNNRISSLDCAKNKLTFESLEPIADLYYFDYAPQDSIGTNESLIFNAGENYSYDLIVGGNYNIYQWYKDGIQLPYQTSSTLNLSNLSILDDGVYTCVVRNNLLPELILFSRQIHLSILFDNISPSNIILSNTYINEGIPIGTEVGTFNTVDENNGDAFTYSFTSGLEDNDNDKFIIVGNKLIVNSEINYELKNSYNIQVETTDLLSETFSKSFIITVNNENESPTDLILSNNSIDENSSIGTEIGILSTTDEDINETFNYNLIQGEGDTDNSRFTITENKLLSNFMFDFETQTSYSVRIQTTDSDGNTFEKQFNISVTNLDEGPTDLLLSNNTITENLAVGTEIGSLSSLSDNDDTTFTYAFISGEGDQDNSSFTINGDKLLSNDEFNYEEKAIYFIRIKTTDNNDESFEKAFTILINDTNDPVNNITLSLIYENINEDIELGTLVGIFSTDDDDAYDEYEFTFVQGEGQDDNNKFTISNNSLFISSYINYHWTPTVSIRVKASNNQGDEITKIFEIDINDIIETNLDTEIEKSIEVNLFPNPTSDILYVDCKNPYGYLYLYNLSGTKIAHQEITSSTTEINVSSYPPGIYLIKVESDGIIETQKFIKK